MYIEENARKKKDGTPYKKLSLAFNAENVPLDDVYELDVEYVKSDILGRMNNCLKVRVRDKEIDSFPADFSVRAKEEGFEAMLAAVDEKIIRLQKGVESSRAVTDDFIDAYADHLYQTKVMIDSVGEYSPAQYILIKTLE